MITRGVGRPSGSAGQAGLRAAEDIARAYEVQLTLGTFDFSKASNVTFEGYAVEWVETYGCTLKLGTREKYTEVLRDHWFPSLGCVRGADITRNPVILPLVRTGMRMGEALALQTADIDIDRRCIHIVQTWGSRTKADQEHRFNSSKGKRDRLVDMSKQLTGMLKLHLAQKASPTEWVYPGKDPKTPMHPVTFPGRWTIMKTGRGHLP